MEQSRTEVNVDPDIAELVPGFCESRKKDLQNLKNFLSGEDFTSIAKVSHTIKGVARPYGFPTLESLSIDLEKAAKAGDKEQCQRILQSIDDYFKAYSDQ